MSHTPTTGVRVESTNPSPSFGDAHVFLPAEQYLGLPRAPEAWIIKPLIPAGGLINLYGSPKIGKSYMALQLALAVAQGHEQWLSFPIQTTGPVMYLQLDTPRSLWAERLEHLKQQGVNLDGLYLADGESAPYPFNILQPDAGLAWLAQQVEAVQPVMVVVDTLREIHELDENKSEMMKVVIAALASCTRPSALLIVSHARKDNPQFGESLLNDNRGTNAIAGRMDTVMRVSQKSLKYVGRAIDERKLPLRRNPDTHFWDVGVDEEQAIRRVLQDTTLHSLRERSEKLGDMLGKTPEAARSILRRRMEAPIPGVTEPAVQ